MSDNQETQVINPAAEEPQSLESQPNQTDSETIKSSEVQPEVTTEEVSKTKECDKPEASEQEEEKVDQENVEKTEETEQKDEVKEEEKPKMDEYCAKAIEDGMKVFEEVSPIEKWTLENESDGIQTYSRYDEATGLKMTRGVGAIARPVDQIKSVLMNPSDVLKWEGSLIANDIMEKTDEYTIIQSLDQKRTLVSQRETVIIIKSFQREDGSTVIMERSIEHPKYPARTEYVRAFVHLWACILTPNKEDANKTECEFIIFLDPKGWVPKALFNTVVNGQALNVQKLKQYLEKN